MAWKRPDITGCRSTRTCAKQGIRQTKNDTIDALIVAEVIRFGLDKANQIQQAAQNSFGIVLASSSFSLIIRQYLEQLKQFESSVAIFDAEIARLMAALDTKLKSRQSGESKNDGHMSKRGSPYLRRAVWLAATVAAFKDPAISLFYQKKLSGTSDIKCLPLSSPYFVITNLIFRLQPLDFS